MNSALVTRKKLDPPKVVYTPAWHWRDGYHIAGYFRGVQIFVIFVVHPDVTKFCTHEIFHTLRSAVYTCSNLYK